MRNEGGGNSKNKLEGLRLWYVLHHIAKLRCVRVNQRETHPSYSEHTAHLLARANNKHHNPRPSAPNAITNATDATWVSEAHMTAGHDQEVGITGDG